MTPQEKQAAWNLLTAEEKQAEWAKVPEEQRRAQWDNQAKDSPSGLYAESLPRVLAEDEQARPCPACSTLMDPRTVLVGTATAWVKAGQQLNGWQCSHCKYSEVETNACPCCRGALH